VFSTLPRSAAPLEIPVAALFGRAAGGVTLDQNQFGAVGVVRAAIGQFTRQYCDGRPFFFSTFCAERMRLCAWWIASSVMRLP